MLLIKLFHKAFFFFFQRGAGKSTPHACLVDNTTWDLVNDIEKLREHLEIPEWQVKISCLVKFLLNAHCNYQHFSSVGFFRYLVGHGEVHWPLHIVSHTLTRYTLCLVSHFFLFLILLCMEKKFCSLRKLLHK